jgi:hypothetical protein
MKTMDQLRDEIHDIAKACNIRVRVEMLSYQLYPNQYCRRLELSSTYVNTDKQAKLLKKLHARIEQYNKQALLLR